MPVVSSLRCVCIERRSRLGHPLMTGTVFDVFIVGRICAEAIIAHTFEVSNERATAPFFFLLLFLLHYVFYEPRFTLMWSRSMQWVYDGGSRALLPAQLSPFATCRRRTLLDEEKKYYVMTFQPCNVHRRRNLCPNEGTTRCLLLLLL